MAKYFVLAVLLGYVLQLLSTFGVAHYLRNTATEKELYDMNGFHVFAVAYFFGALLKYGGYTLTAAYLVKQFILT